MRKKLLTQGFLSAFGEGVYVLLVALLIRNGDKLFGNRPSILGIVVFLMLFVVSAAISGALILGKPILLYLEGEKKEAFELFGLTLGWMFLFLLVLLAAMTLLR